MKKSKKEKTKMIRNEKVLDDINALLDYDSIKDYLYMNVINADENKSELSQVPHTIVGDLAIVYRVMIQTTEEQFCSAKVTNQMMDVYGIDVNKLHNDALISSPRIMKPEILPLETLAIGTPKETALQDTERNLVVLTNEHKTDGASTMFYAGVLNDLATKLNHSLYIIPSSTDECIAVCDSSHLDYKHLENMLHEVNDSSLVDPDKKLSDHLYHYDKDEHIFEKAEDCQKRIFKQKYSQLLH